MTDVSLEQVVLASLLVDGAAWDDVADLFRVDLFADPSCRAIAEVVADFAQRAKPLDAALICSELAAKGRGAAAATVGELVRSIGTAAGARSYVERLRSLWVGREARRVAAEVLESSGPGEDLVGRAIEQLATLEASPSGRGARKLGEIVSQRIEELEDEAKNPSRPTPGLFPTGFERLDYLIGGVRAGHPIILSARPSQGKSALAVALADNLSASGVPTAIFQLEDTGGAFADRVLMRRSKVNGTLLRHGSQLRREHWDRLLFAADPMLQQPLWVDDDKGLCARELCARMRRLRREQGVRVFLVDHVKEIRLEALGGQDRHDLMLGRAVQQLRDTAAKLEAGLVLMHQMNRAVESRREDSEPRLSDLKDSGDLEAIARVVAFLSIPAGMRGKFVIDVAKNTHGPKGKVILDWLEDYAGVMETGGGA